MGDPRRSLGAAVRFVVFENVFTMGCSFDGLCKLALWVLAYILNDSKDLVEVTTVSFGYHGVVTDGCGETLERLAQHRGVHLETYTPSPYTCQMTKRRRRLHYRYPDKQ